MRPSAAAAAKAGRSPTSVRPAARAGASPVPSSGSPVVTVEVTPALVDQPVAYLDQPDDSARLWKALVFMEEKGLDPSLASRHLAGYLRDSGSPIPDAEHRSDEELRAVALALRDRARSIAGLAPLTAEQRRSWQWKIVPLPKTFFRGPQSKRWGVNRGGGVDPVPLERELRERYPELLHAVFVFAAENGPLTQENEDSGQSYFWFFNDLASAIMELRPTIGGIDAAELADLIVRDYENTGVEDPK